MSKDEIKEICDHYKIENWALNDDGSIDVNGDVDLYDMSLTELPLIFRNVSGYFECSANRLLSLKGCPISVGGYFECSDNRLTSLVGCPISVGGDFDCSDNRLSSLVGCPISIGGDFECRWNDFNILDIGNFNKEYYRQYLRDYKLKQILNV